MIPRSLSLIASVLACAALVAAYDQGDVTSLDGESRPPTGAGAPAENGSPSTQPGGGASGGGATSGGTPTNSPEGKQYYAANVHPFLAASCGGCHESAGPGPAWISKA